VVETLLRADAPIRPRNLNGDDALALAERAGHTAVAERLRSGASASSGLLDLF
jgi:hypothetical protein